MAVPEIVNGATRENSVQVAPSSLPGPASWLLRFRAWPVHWVFRLFEASSEHTTSPGDRISTLATTNIGSTSSARLDSPLSVCRHHPYCSSPGQSSPITSSHPSKPPSMPIRPASLRFGQNAPPTGAAFALVRQLLSERPRHFQELLHDGIKALGGETKRTSADVPAPGEAAAKSSKKGKSKGKAVVQDFTNPVPEGHPFVSGA